MVATKSQATSDLGPYIDRLRRCVETSIQQFLAEQGPRLAFMAGITKATFVRDYIVSSIRAEFPDGEDGITHHTSHGLFLLNMQGRYILKFKKFDGKLRTRNHVTQTTLDWLLQQPLVLFPDLPPVTHLHVGYKPGATLSSSTVWITCPDGETLSWVISLSEAAEPLDLPLEIPPMVPGSRIAARPLAKPMRKSVERNDGPHGSR